MTLRIKQQNSKNNECIRIISGQNKKVCCRFGRPEHKETLFNVRLTQDDDKYKDDKSRMPTFLNTMIPR